VKKSWVSIYCCCFCCHSCFLLLFLLLLLLLSSSFVLYFLLIFWFHVVGNLCKNHDFLVLIVAFVSLCYYLYLLCAVIFVLQSCFVFSSRFVCCIVICEKCCPLCVMCLPPLVLFSLLLYINLLLYRFIYHSYYVL